MRDDVLVWLRDRSRSVRVTSLRRNMCAASTRSINASLSVTMPSRFDVWITDAIWKVFPSRMRFAMEGMVSSTSRAATRPPPIFLQSVCEITPRSDSDNIARTCSCRSGGN